MTDAPDKGKENGSCNRKACQRPGAVFFNTSTRAWYCAPCAHKINNASPGLCYVPDKHAGDRVGGAGRMV